MNSEQLMSLARMALVAGGTFLGTKYGIDAATVTSAANLVVSAAAAVSVAASAIWGIYQNTHKATIAKAAELSSVQKIVMTDPAKADAIPSTKVVSPY